MKNEKRGLNPLKNEREPCFFQELGTLFGYFQIMEATGDPQINK